MAKFRITAQFEFDVNTDLKQVFERFTPTLETPDGFMSLKPYGFKYLQLEVEEVEYKEVDIEKL